MRRRDCVAPLTHKRRGIVSRAAADKEHVSVMQAMLAWSFRDGYTSCHIAYITRACLHIPHLHEATVPIFDPLNPPTEGIARSNLRNFAKYPDRCHCCDFDFQLSKHIT